jgi:hypothetical protein
MSEDATFRGQKATKCGFITSKLPPTPAADNTQTATEEAGK